jgi:hypothetical protein
VSTIPTRTPSASAIRTRSATERASIYAGVELFQRRKRTDRTGPWQRGGGHRLGPDVAKLAECTGGDGTAKQSAAVKQ